MKAGPIPSQALKMTNEVVENGREIAALDSRNGGLDEWKHKNCSPILCRQTKYKSRQP